MSLDDDAVTEWKGRCPERLMDASGGKENRFSWLGWRRQRQLTMTPFGGRLILSPGWLRGSLQTEATPFVLEHD